MKRTYWFLIVTATVSVFCKTGCQAHRVASAHPRLPGTRAIIDASFYPTLQAAIDEVPDEGGVVRIPPGTFEIEEPLKVTTSDMLIEGAGTATHIKNINVEGKPALILQHPGGVDDRKRELWRIRLANFRITGNEKSGCDIEAWRINEIFIDGVTVSHYVGDGIVLDNCYENLRIRDSLITYNKNTGLNLIGCHDIIVSSNQFEENRDAVRCIDSFNLTMTGNNLDDHLGDGVIIENTYGSVVSGNMIEECRGTAIVLDRDCYGITLCANVIAHNESGGIDLRDAHGSTVGANTFTIMGGHALAIGSKSGRITVTSNKFSDSYIGDDKVKRGTGDLKAGGMIVCGASDVAISGNVFSGVRPKALTLEGEPTRQVVFTNNVLTDVESDHKKLDDSSLVDNNLEPVR